MRAIITHQPSCEVTRIDRFADETIFYLATGQHLRVGVAPNVLETRLRIDLAQPPSRLPTDIFCHPFMTRAFWEVIAPIVRTHPDIQRLFAGHPKLQALAQSGYDELRELPLRAYITSALYLSYPCNFMNTTINPDRKTTQYRCDFADGDDYLVKVVVDLKSQAVTVTQ